MQNGEFTQKQKYILYGLIMIKLLLGVLFINRLCIDLDEPFSIFHAQKSLTEMNALFFSENNPPLHFWLLHFWIKFFGISPVSVRSLSLLYSLLTIPVLFNLGKILKNSTVGLLLVGLFVFSNFHHSFGLEARTYSLLSLLFSLSLLLLVKSVEHKSWKNSVLFAVVLGLIFYTHYMALLIVPMLFLAFLFSNFPKVSKSDFLHTALVFVLLITLALPLLLPLMARLQHVQDVGTWVPKPQWSELYGVFNKLMNGPGFILVLVAVVLFLIIRQKEFFVALIQTLNKNRKLVLVALCSLGLYFSAFVISKIGNNSVFLDRYLFFVNIGFFALLAWLVDGLKPKFGAWRFVLLVAVIFGFNPLKTHNRESDKLVAYAKQFGGSVVISPPYYDLTFVYHWDQNLFEAGHEKNALFQHEVYPIYDINDIAVIQLKKPIVLVDADSKFVFGEQKIKNQLLQKFTMRESRTFLGNYEVVVFD